jgi:GAF domain-containing protein
VPDDEPDRLDALARLLAPGPLPTAYLDDVVLLAAQVCAAPVAVFSLIHADRQEVLASYGAVVADLPRDVSFCTHAVAADGLVEVPDTTTDLRFADSAIVRGERGARYYAGTPVRTADGQPVGVLCVFDTAARRMAPDQRVALESLARMASAHLELARPGAPVC